MATDLDLFAIKERIKAILENNSTLYDATGAGSKVRLIEAGAPDLDNINRVDVIPHIFITNDDVIEEIRPNSIVQGNSIKGTDHIVFFRIILVVDGKDGATAEEDADDKTKLIKEIITDNYALEDPANPGTDAKVTRAEITRHSILNPVLFGSSKQGRVLRLRAVAFTS